MAEPYDTLLERYETLAEVGASSASVILTVGRGDFQIGDAAKINWAPSLAELIADQNVTVVVAENDLSTYSKGDTCKAELTGLPASFAYMATVEYDGTEYNGERIEAHCIPAATQTVLIQNISDSHLMESVHDGHSGRLAVITNTVSNMVADQEEIGLPTLVNSTGDCTPYAKGALPQLIFPINEDGSTIPGGNTSYAQSMTDTRRDCRLYKGYFGPAFRRAMYTRVQGNHDAPQHWHYAANNSGHNDAATYSYQAFNEHFGNPANIGGWTGNSNGLWGTMRYGPVLCCYMNPYIDTILTVSAASATPMQPDNNNDWTLGQTQWDHFFNAATGTIATANPTVTPFVVVFIHNVLGGSSTPSVLKRYAWGGARYISEKKALAAGEVFETGPGAMWTNPRGWTGPRQQLGLQRAMRESSSRRKVKILVIYGHAHCYIREPVEGIMWVMCGRPAGTNQTPQDIGHAQQGGWFDGETFTNTDPNALYRTNSGHMNIIADPRRMVVQYKRSILAGQVSSDGFNTNGAIADEFTLYAESNTLRLDSPAIRQAKADAGSIRSHRVNKSANRRVTVGV